MRVCPLTYEDIDKKKMLYLHMKCFCYCVIALAKDTLLKLVFVSISRDLRTERNETKQLVSKSANLGYQKQSKMK